MVGGSERHCIGDGRGDDASVALPVRPLALEVALDDDRCGTAAASAGEMMRRGRRYEVPRHGRGWDAAEWVSRDERTPGDVLIPL